MRKSTLIKNLRENKNFPILESYFQTWANNGELSQTELRNLIDVYTNIILTVNNINPSQCNLRFHFNKKIPSDITYLAKVSNKQKQLQKFEQDNSNSENFETLALIVPMKDLNGADIFLRTFNIPKQSNPKNKINKVHKNKNYNLIMKKIQKNEFYTNILIDLSHELEHFVQNYYGRDMEKFENNLNHLENVKLDIHKNAKTSLVKNYINLIDTQIEYMNFLDKTERYADNRAFLYVSTVLELMLEHADYKFANFLKSKLFYLDIEKIDRTCALDSIKEEHDSFVENLEENSFIKKRDFVID
ncbi:MAG: hypothetical protein ACI4L6_03870 [Candidatus Onthoplasma sp.]